MKKTEIYTIKESDQNIFFIYECDDRMEMHRTLIGINFHMGADNLDMSYSENDQDLFEIYLDVFTKRETKQKFDKITIVQEAITIYLQKIDEAIRKEIIKEEVNAAISDLFSECHERCLTTSGDITPAQIQTLDEIKSNLRALILEQINQNL